MSQINDALKRAQNAQRESLPSNVSPLRPIEIPRKEYNFRWILPVVIILLIVIAVFLIAISTARQSVKNIVTPTVAAPPLQVETLVAPAPDVPAPSPDVIGPAAIHADAPKQTRIQGIAFDPVNPWAIISGKTVYVGDYVDGMRITAISRNAITLVGDGRTNQLFVGQQ